ncbi:MAG: hypothetical protein ACRCYO_02305 [Bacteroidia bacterium]
MPSLEKANQDSIESIAATNEVQDEKSLVSDEEEKMVVLKTKTGQPSHVKKQTNSSTNDQFSKQGVCFKNLKGEGIGKPQQVSVLKQTAQKTTNQGDFSEPKFWKSCLLVAFLMLAISGVCLATASSFIFTWVGIVAIVAGFFALLVTLISFLCRKEKNPHLRPDPNTGEISKKEKNRIWIMYSLGAFFMSIILGFLGIFGLAFIALA